MIQIVEGDDGPRIDIEHRELRSYAAVAAHCEMRPSIDRVVEGWVRLVLLMLLKGHPHHFIGAAVGCSVPFVGRIAAALEIVRRERRP